MSSSFFFDASGMLTISSYSISKLTFFIKDKLQHLYHFFFVVEANWKLGFVFDRIPLKMARQSLLVCIPARRVVVV